MKTSMNPYLRKSLYLVAIIGMFVLFMFLRKNQNKQICEEIVVEIEAPIEKQIITSSRIKDKLDEWYDGGLSGVQQQNLSLYDIEERLEEIPAVKNAEVSFDLRGTLHIAIEQRLPVVRIINSNGESYYLSLDNFKIPVAGTDVARVPICNGRLSTSMIKKVYTLSTYVYENEFMEALTEQIFVNNNSDLVIIPKIKNQRVIIGDTLDLEAKFKKLKDFYVHGLNHIGWDKYRTINLKFKDQIVCN